jgi:hypothetical protein
MSSNFVKLANPIKKSLNSGTSFAMGGTHTKTNLHDNYIVKNGEFTSNIGTSNIVYPLNDNFQTDTPNQYNFNSASNAMIPSGDFNVIKIDLSTMETNYDTRLDIFYGYSQSIGKGSIKYSTIIPPSSNFYRNFPIENEFFTISLTNLNTIGLEPSLIHGRVSLAKYTQYNAPVQINDDINRYSMATLNRVGNDYNLDILTEKITDVKKTDRLGVMPSDLGLEEMVVWGASSNTDFNFTKGLRPLVLRSEGLNAGNDINKNITIEGIGIDNQFITENLVCDGTSNVFSLVDYKFVGNMYLTNGGEIEGDYMIVADRDNGEVFNYMSNESNRTTSMLYTCPSNKDAIIENVVINGRVNLSNGNYFSLERINYSSNTRTLIYQDRTIDDSINSVVTINFKLNAGDCVIGRMKGGQGVDDTSNLGVSSIVSRMNIIELNNSIEAI